MKKPQNQLPSQEELSLISSRAEAILGYEFKDKSLIIRALTHPSAVESDTTTLSYERLEFLGDSYLGLIIGEKLFEDFPKMDEGELTRMKSNVVSGATLSSISDSLGFSDLIIIGESERNTGRRGLHSALENVFEATVAAIALDGGYDAARDWVLRVTEGILTEDLAKVRLNSKSRLQEVLQAERKSPVYKVVDEQGPAHDRTFFVEVECEGVVLGHGSGHSKKEAEMAAAEEALATLEQRG